MTLLQMIRSFAPSTTSTVGIVVGIVAFSRYSSTLDSAQGAALAVDDLAFSYWVSKLEEESPVTLTVELDDLAAGAQLHSELSGLEAADAALAAAVTKLAEVMPDVRCSCLQKEERGFQQKEPVPQGFFPQGFWHSGTC